ncbi:MAG TPA: YggT family protein [Dehalococcoidia bacterium]|nr:YggT family protein [Dehalococcoidia bacterium]
MTSIVELIAILLNVLVFAIFARAIITWFPIDRDGPIVRTLDAITEPVLEPLRRVIPMIGMIDISPMVAIVLLSIISSQLSASV